MNLTRGFLPDQDPDSCLTQPGLAMLDEVGKQLPQMLQQDHARTRLAKLDIPLCVFSEQQLGQARLYYLRVAFIASAYINQVGAPVCRLLPANIAKPLLHICQLLQRPPILSYDAYALYNWYRLDKAQPVCLGNIDTLQNFVELYDEHWFILIHIEIEAIAARQLDAITDLFIAFSSQQVNTALTEIDLALVEQIAVLKRIPERMSADLYFAKFRPYIRFFEDVQYQGLAEKIDFRGETGAQSSIMPCLEALLKITHQPNALTQHLRDMRNYMPAQHRQFLTQVQALPEIKPIADKQLFNQLLEHMAEFREVHYGWATQYIHDKVSDPRGTGGTPFMQWLKQLIDETRAFSL